MRVLFIVALGCMACSGEPARPSSPSGAISRAALTASAPTPEAPPPPACPLVAMKLVSQPPDGAEVVMVSVDEAGRVEGVPQLAALSGQDPVIARFDERGCLFDPSGGVVSELTREGEIWLTREVLEAPARTVAHLTIEDDGRISSSRDGGPTPMRLVGFEERGLCTGKLLVGAMLAIFAGASMAVVDGVAGVMPPPADSVCPERHRAP